MELTNSDRLQEIRERAEKATPAPWKVESELFPTIESADGSMRIYDEGGHGYKDAIFIAKAREDIPYLLQLVTEQQREIEQLRTALEPGKASAIVMGMFDEAERLGHSRFSSKHALSFFIEEIERLRKQPRLVPFEGEDYLP